MAYPIILCGTGRSGTAMLFKLLNMHPQVFAFGETKFIEHAYIREFPQAWIQSSKNPILIEQLKKFMLGPVFRFNIAPPSREARYRGFHNFMDQAEMRSSLGMLNDIRHCTTVEAVRIVIGRYFDTLFSRLAFQNKKLFWAEKTPENSIYPDIIHQMFPSMKLLNIYRDGRDVACSFMEQPWGVPDFEFAITWWATRMATFIQKTNSIPKDFIKNIKYEDFITNYPDSLSDTLEFLGIPYAPELEKFEMKQTSIGRWRNELTPKQITFCKDKFGAIFDYLEYPI